MKRYVDANGVPYDVWHIPLRVRYSFDPCGGEDWERWLRNQPRPTFLYGKTRTWVPREQYIPPAKLNWAVESFNWWEPPDPDGLPPKWNLFRRFRTKEAARDFCTAYRAQEKEQKEAYRARCAWRKVNKDG